MALPLEPADGPALVVTQGVSPGGSRYVLLERAGRATVYGVDTVTVHQDASAALNERLLSPQGALAASLAQRPDFQARADTSQVVRQLNVGNTHHCNLACTYCYNELPSQTKKAGGDTGWMTPEVARTMVDALLAQSGDAPSVSLVWIGGEALLQQQLIEDTVAEARQKGEALGKQVDVVVYSNGVTLTREVVEWADEHAVSLVVSLDGPPKIHDRDRLFAGGRPTARIVLDNIRQFLELSHQPVRRVRSVVKGRRPQLPLHQYLFDLGFNEIQVQAAYDESGVDGRNGVGDLDALLGWYETLLLSGVTIAIEPYATILERLAHGGESPANHYPCGAGSSLLGVTPDGSLVPCHHFVRDPGPPVGHVRDGLPLPVLREKLSLPVLEREPCKSCWARHVCGGDCYHRAYAAGHGYTGVMTDECDARREIYARTIELYGRVLARRPDVLNDVIDRNLTEVAPNPRAFEQNDLSLYE